jgi:hypothetical protein
MADRVTVLAVFNALLRIASSGAKLEMMLKESDAVIDRFTASWAAAERCMPGALKEQTDKAQVKLTDAMKGGHASETAKNVFQRALHRLADET